MLTEGKNDRIFGVDTVYLKACEYDGVIQIPLLEILTATFNPEESRQRKKFVLENDNGDRVCFNSNELKMIFGKFGLVEFGEIEAVVIQPGGHPLTEEVAAFIAQY